MRLTMARYSLTVRGDRKTWAFPVRGEPEHVESWREDGLEVDEVVGSFPAWLPMPLARLWMAISDLALFRRGR